MEEIIRGHQNDPRKLEELYRSDRVQFKRSFEYLYPELQGKPLMDFWHERLHYDREEISWGSGRELRLVLLVSLLAGFFVQIPEIFDVDHDFFYPRNVSLIVFPLLTAYFCWKHHIPKNKLFFFLWIFVVSGVYINLLPDGQTSDTLLLACIHLPLILWAVLGASFAGNQLRNSGKRLEFLRYNGDLLVMTAIILLAGGLLTGVTLGLFSLIDLNIEEFYFQYIAMSGVAAAPILGTFLIQSNPHLVSKISPVIARVFSPLLLVTLVIYLLAVLVTGKDPYNDREFLVIFNVLLIGVMAIIIFSIAEISQSSRKRVGLLVLSGLSLMTIVVNAIALSAIIFRISEWGFTPNRLAVLGGNLLILIHLCMVSIREIQALKDHSKINQIENSIALFLPVYIGWAILVTFLFPVLFNFQ